MFFVTLDRLEREPDTVPRGQNIVILHAGQVSDRPRWLKYLEYNDRFIERGLSLSVLYIADTLDEAEAKARADGWGFPVRPHDLCTCLPL